MKKSLVVLAAAAILASCSTNQPKMLVLYYSQSGTTQKVAEEIATQTGADIERFDVVDPYNGSYDETIQRFQKEKESGVSQVAKPLSSDLSKYDVVFLGYPIWFGTYAPPVAALLKGVNLDGKVVVPFCTFGSGGLEGSVKDLRKALPGADIREGYGIRAARIGNAAAEVDRFLILGGYKEGTAEEYPEYSAQEPVTDAEAAIFDAACSSYQFPLGTPVSFGKRETSSSTDYLFTATNVGRDGNVSESKIYVTVGKAAGSVPEFTRVVRAGDE